jgi:hypothetical protein
VHQSAQDTDQVTCPAHPVWVMRADGRRPRPLFGPSSQSFDVEPEFSPDGSKVIFARLIEEPGSPFRTAIFVAGADDSRYGN